MDFARVETAELSDAELDNVAGGIGADVNADADADLPPVGISSPGVGYISG